ncbi:hypothetical protein Phum_PHUM239250 [Pediculus humanus corporis]|uniref:Uncharacterized protein n=1 Tax=Pediculus humanus subsp. corporis TaxID=121224 RepID=E0VJ74_PEDHC|nr:uncharacterized protein Phum_PHUM239250 [Pediculus humanus corporis]EEB13430.1 hypothetical protein Phum_PHUM239250 [Pediculus humanus corporis]
MLLTMRRTEEPDKRGVRIKEEEEEVEQEEQVEVETKEYYKLDKPEGSVLWKEEIDETIFTCEPSDNETEFEKRKLFGKKIYVRQFGIDEERQENEYVDITQVQQLLLDSATSSGKVASIKNRTGERQDCQQQQQQQFDTANRFLTSTEESKILTNKIIHRPHSQPSCSSFPNSQQPYYRPPQDRYYPHPLKQPDYYVGKFQNYQDQSLKPRMLAESIPSNPHLQPPAPQTGGHSPNVEELFALWFGSAPGNTEWKMLGCYQK